MVDPNVHATTLQIWGAGCFGAILGWYLYFINRYRTGEVGFGDLTTIIGIVGGVGVLALFPAGTDLFGSYGIGLAVGFFGYYFVLAGLVSMSKNFDVDFFLDGRRKAPTSDYLIPEGFRQTVSGMDATFQAGGPVNPPPSGPVGPR